MMASVSLSPVMPSAPSAGATTPPAPAGNGERSFARQLDAAVERTEGRGPRREPAAEAADTSTPREEASSASSEPGAETAEADSSLAERETHDPLALLPGWASALPAQPAAAAVVDASRADAASAELESNDEAASRAPRRIAGAQRDERGRDAPVGMQDTSNLGAAQAAPAGGAAAVPSAEVSGTAAGPGAAVSHAVRESVPATGWQAMAGQPVASGPAGAAPTGASAPPFQAQLSAALGSPEFAPALGVQLSILAREGVQQARLHLHPAEMGPIAVQIVVDGSQAQVHFQADVAATRAALQNSLPELAQALRDSGFTLSGGGVSGGGAQREQAPGSRAPGGTPRDGADESDRSGLEPARTGAAPARPRGVVDLYA